MSVSTCPRRRPSSVGPPRADGRACRQVEKSALGEWKQGNAAMPETLAHGWVEASYK